MMPNGQSTDGGLTLCLSIPDKYNLPIPHIDKLSVCPIDKKPFSIRHIDKFSI